MPIPKDKSLNVVKGRTERFEAKSETHKFSKKPVDCPYEFLGREPLFNNPNEIEKFRVRNYE